MGYTDPSVDFYIDAVLTDHGRQQLSRNDGSFSVVRFRFADDEIDYRNWNQLTGSDNMDSKILDSPIFEAFTNETIALRYPLVTIRNSTLQYMPTMVANPTSVSLKARTDTTGGGVAVVASQQATRSQVVIPAELVDFNYIIQVDNDLLYVANETPTAVQPNGVAQYIVPADAGVSTSANGTQATFTLRVQTLNTTIFDILVGATVAKPRTLSTNAVVIGQQSGLRTSIPVTVLEFTS